MKHRFGITAATLAVVAAALAAGTAYADDTTHARHSDSRAAQGVPTDGDCFALALWPRRTGTLNPKVSGSAGPDCTNPADMFVDVALYQANVGKTARHVEASNVTRLVGTATRPCVSGVYYVGAHYRVVKQDGSVFEGDVAGPAEFVDCG